VTYSPATKKPIAYVQEFFDAASRASLGVHDSSEDLWLDKTGSTLQPKFKIGERKYFFSKSSDHCFDMATWNRVGAAGDVAIAFLLGEGVTTANIQAAYGSDASTLDRLVAAIKANQPFDPKWASAFQLANAVYGQVDQINSQKEYTYDVRITDATSFSSYTARSYARDSVYVQDKSVTTAQNLMTFSLRPGEILVASFCY
jgi:hypothetical protein